MIKKILLLLMSSGYSQSDTLAILNNRYHLVKKIGKGATSTVYLGYDELEKSNQLFAFKILRNSITINENETFKNEAKTLSLIENANIVHFYESGTSLLKKTNGKSKEVSYIKTEYLEHGDLFDFVYYPKKGLGENLGRLVLYSIISGLEAIHNKGFVHRDLKTENIMVNSSFNIKIADFGFATKIEGPNGNGKQNGFLGTPAYAAPELLLKTPYYGVCNDIFSLGVIMFVVVTGAMPFRLAVFNDMFYSYIMKGDYEAFWKKRNIKLSQNFMQLFNSMVAFDPIQRPSLAEIKESKWMSEGHYSIDNFYLLREECVKRLNVVQRKKAKKNTTSKKK